MKEKVIYETGDFWVQKNSRGDFEVYRSGDTHSVRVATFGKSLPNAHERAVNEAQRRHAVEAYAEGERLGYIKKETHMAAPKKKRAAKKAAPKKASKKAAPKKRAAKKAAPKRAKKRAAKKAAPAKRKRAPRGQGLMTRKRIAQKGTVLGGVSRAIYSSSGRPILVRIFNADETAKIRKK